MSARGPTAAPAPVAADAPLYEVIRAARACQVCAEHLPLGPRPVMRATETARLAIIGQAPGTKVHESGIPWNDASGERLRDWLQLDKRSFYDESAIAIVPMGFCYPGVDARGGDKPPRPECAPLWHEAILSRLPALKMTLLIGQYAQKRYLGERRSRTLTETVSRWSEFTPTIWPLPHPSWRNTAWIRRHPWFETDLLPALRKAVTGLL